MLKDGLQALRSGHWPTLLGAWLHFEISFMVWLLIGAMGIPISEEFSLSASQKGLLVGIPLLGGALFRVIVGPLGDRLGAKVVGLGILGLEGIGLLLGWLGGTSFESMLGIGLFLGFAGASFAIALPLASQAYPSAHQGLAMGVAGIGNSGVLLAAFMAPRLAEALDERKRVHAPDQRADGEHQHATQSETENYSCGTFHSILLLVYLLRDSFLAERVCFRCPAFSNSWGYHLLSSIYSAGGTAANKADCSSRQNFLESARSAIIDEFVHAGKYTGVL